MPIVTGFATLVLAVLLAIIYPAFDAGLTSVGEWVAANSIIGGFVYGTANRLLIPLGLHHILNSVPWFILGDYTNPATGTVVHGDISRFLAGDKTAGAFMTGFFPIMMFALPAAALAIWQEAKFKSRKLVGGLMMTAALTSFLTGVTEPLEFAFMFVAWPLYVIHAVLTGTSMALANALGIKDGFGFSAGLFDYVLNFNIATKPLWLIVMGLGYAAVYYLLFRWVIRRWNLRTPGREDDDDDSIDAAAAVAETATEPATETGTQADPRRWEQVLLSADRVVLPSGSVEPGWVETNGDRITGAGGGTPPAPADRHLTGTLVPGFVDAHSHGGGGAAFTSGDPADAATVLATHRAHGTTSMMASLVTDTTERLEASVRALAPLVRSGELAGIHLEGPWLSGAHCGAHDPALLRAPDPAEVTRLLDAGDGTVRMVTLAPELDGGLEAVAVLAPPGRHRGARAQRRDVRRGAGGPRCRRLGRDPPVQRDAADPPPRARAGAGARRGPPGRSSS